MSREKAKHGLRPYEVKETEKRENCSFDSADATVRQLRVLWGTPAAYAVANFKACQHRRKQTD